MNVDLDDHSVIRMYRERESSECKVRNVFRHFKVQRYLVDEIQKDSSL